MPQYEYEYNHPYEVGKGVDIIVDTWYENKADTPIFRTLEKHPNYNGRYQIVLDESFHRNIDGDEVSEFINWMRENMDYKEGESVLYGDTETEVYGAHVSYARPNSICMEIGNYLRANYTFYIERENCHPVDGRKIMTAEQCRALGAFKSCPMQYLNDELRERFNEAFPWLKIHAGAKASKVFRRICKDFELDKIDEFKQRWPRFADAINPLEVKRWTIVSWHPIDYFTMSFGNDWQSCHTIDKTGKRHVGGDHYNGCYSSGTLSYMLDGSSVVVYTVDKSYEGNEFELQPKMSRQMFHLSEDIMVQGRLYPQGNDVGAEDAYNTMRNIVQRVYAEAFGVPNMWTLKRGTSECCEVILTEDGATNYRDYQYYDNCTVSKRNGWGGQMIVVGHAPICPTCGCTHGEQDYIMCEDCRDIKKCVYCGEELGDEYIETADGNYYCDEYCARNDGYVWCANTYEWRHYGSWNDDDVIYDDYDGEYYYVGYISYITTEDGNHYIAAEHAIEDGYEYIEDENEWIPADEARYCDHCERTVRESNYNEDLGMCDDCAEREEVTA